MIRPRLGSLILFLSLALVASYVSVMVLTERSFTSGGVVENYGFPLPWETLSWTFCSQSPSQPHQAYSILNGQCLAAPCCATTYNFAFLLFDVLFYMGIGYLLLFSYRRLMRGIDRRASELVASQSAEPEESANVENEQSQGE